MLSMYLSPLYTGMITEILGAIMVNILIHPSPNATLGNVLHGRSKIRQVEGGNRLHARLSQKKYVRSIISSF